MGLRGPPCPKHPTHLPVGVCASCLQERLAKLSELESQLAQVASHSISYITTNNNSSDNQWPSMHTIQGLRPIITEHQPDPPTGPELVTNKTFNLYTLHERAQAQTSGGGRHSFSHPRRVTREIRKNGVISNGLPADGINTHAKLPVANGMHGCTHIPVEKNVDTMSLQSKPSNPTMMATSDHITDTSRSILGARRSLSFAEHNFVADKCTRNSEIQISDASPNPKSKKKTLSSLFSIDDADYSAPKRSMSELTNRHSVVGAKSRTTIGQGAPYTDAQPVKAMQRNFGHASFSERSQANLYSIPVLEESKPTSWFTSLFRKHKKKPRAKPEESIARTTEHSLWEKSRQSWEAPRSSWEPKSSGRFSSFEGPRSSWDSRKPQGNNGDSEILDRDAFLRGFDFLSDRFYGSRCHSELDSKRLREFAKSIGDFAKEEENKRFPLKATAAELLKSPQGDVKDMARTFISTRDNQMQRDASTQTTPPRLSDAEDDVEDPQEYNISAKNSNTMWNKVWSKKWAFKKKHQKGYDQNGAHSNIDVKSNAGHSGISTDFKSNAGYRSFREQNGVDSTDLSEFRHLYMMEHEAWDACKSRTQSFRSVIDSPQFVQLDHKLGIKKGLSDNDSSRRRSLHLENGMMNLYCAPINGHSNRG